jgi:2Fe-2S ferredoxin
VSKIKFAKNYDPIEAPAGKVLMQHLIEAGLPIASSCGGNGICGKCKVNVILGADKLSKMTEEERLCLERNLGHPDTQRLSCQCEISGDILIDTDYW